MAFFTERKNIRLANYSYSSQGAYFVTICTADRKPIMCRIVRRDTASVPEVRLSAVGRVVFENVQRIRVAYPIVTVDKFVIMPNHVHLLLQIHAESVKPDESRDKMLVSKVIQSFKASVSRNVKSDYKPLWQPRFNDRIVRNKEEYLRIWKYIDDNPSAWLDDDYYVEC